MQHKRHQATKRVRTFYKTAQDHSTKSRQQANRTGHTYTLQAYEANPFRQAKTESAR